jgi:hypothetical protein
MKKAKRIIKVCTMTLREVDAEKVREKIISNPKLNFKFYELEKKSNTIKFMVKYDSYQDELFKELIILLIYTI